MLKYFLCPDGVTRPIVECWEHCPRPEGRCLSLPTLYEVGRDRPWKGIPSTTQLLSPTRMEYLKIVEEYGIDPFDSAFMLLGTRHHQKLEAVAKRIEGLIAEKKLDADDISKHTGILDLLEPSELNEGTWKIIDYKTFGSFAVAKVLARSDNGEPDRKRIELQINDYRIKAESLGFKISQLFIQCTVRDGGTWVAKKNQVPEKLILIPVASLDNEEVIEYFSVKRDALLTALAEKKLPEICGYEERWRNRRCTGNFCPVAAWCPEGRAMNKMPAKEA